MYNINKLIILKTFINADDFNSIKIQKVDVLKTASTY